jgi:signal transduction histidine kinase
MADVQVQLAEAKLLLLVNVGLILLIVVFAAVVAIVLVRRSLRQRVEAERLAAMGTATARILHQVKNPLQTLLLHAEMLDDAVLIADSTARGEIARAIVGEAARMSELLSELSAYASGVRRRLELEPVALGRLVREAAARAFPEGGPVAASVGRLQDDGPPVRGDAYFLRQALENVFRNAVEALIDEEAQVAAPAVTVTLRRRGAEAVLEVSDNGPGIAPDRLATVFEPFVTSKPRGMGLGLPICREIVEGHGGRIELRSPAGGGVTVVVALPIAHEEAPRGAAPGAPATPARRNAHTPG